METGTATEQMTVNYENQCEDCLIAKTYLRYALKTTNQGVYRNKVWSCAESARLLHKIRFFFLGQMTVLLCSRSKSTFVCTCLGECNLFQLHRFGHWVRIGFVKELLLVKQIKRIWSACIGRAATPYALTGAIPLLLAASTLSCWMSPLARIALPQTTWPPRVPPECPCWRRA